jgi:DNA-binding protein HU-beta
MFYRQNPVKRASGGHTRQKNQQNRVFQAVFLFTCTRSIPYDEDALRAASLRGPVTRPVQGSRVQGNNPYNDTLGDSRRGFMADRMTQTQLVKELAAASGVANKLAKTMLESFASIAVRETKKSGVFVLPGLGRLVRVERKARMGRNPATGAAIKIPAKKVVKFRVAKAVKDAIVPPKKAK